MRALALLLLATACGSAPRANSALEPLPPPPPPVAEAPEPAPPPEPLAFEQVRIDQKLTLAPSGLGAIDVRLLSEAELVQALPARLRAPYQSVDKSYQAYRTAFNASHKSEAHRGASNRARKSFQVALARVLKTLRSELDKKPTGALGIAVARLAVWNGNPTRPSTRRNVYYGSAEENEGSERAIAPLELAMSATTADETIGRSARLELVHHLMATDDAPRARSILAELLPQSAPDLRPQLLFRLAVLDALAGNHAVAAEGFRSAHADLAVTSGVSRLALLRGELLANQRLQKFAAVLALAKEAFTESDSPSPLKPDPNPPPPAPPPKKASKGTPRPTAMGLLATLSSSDYSVLGALSYDTRRESFAESDTVELAADAVERLALDPMKLDGSARLQAGILSRLAVRAHYRGDDQAARKYASRAEQLDQDESIDGLRVLRVLAERAGDDDRVAALDRNIAQMRYLGGEGEGIEQDFLLAEIRSKTSDPKTDPKTGPPRAERIVRSLVRVCLEPLRHDLPDAAEKEQLLTEMTLAAKVYPGGKVEVEEPSFAWGSVETQPIKACLRSLAPRVLASAASSVRVSVSITTKPRSRGLFGDTPLGESFGYGGLGLRGSGLGGGGTGLGAGTIGTRGSGGGSIGGIGGSGTRGLGNPKQPPAKPAPKKKP